jgi:hypothetical protein
LNHCADAPTRSHWFVGFVKLLESLDGTTPADGGGFGAQAVVANVASLDDVDNDEPTVEVTLK